MFEHGPAMHGRPWFLGSGMASECRVAGNRKLNHKKRILEG